MMGGTRDEAELYPHMSKRTGNYELQEQKTEGSRPFSPFKGFWTSFVTGCPNMSFFIHAAVTANSLHEQVTTEVIGALCSTFKTKVFFQRHLQ